MALDAELYRHYEALNKKFEHQILSILEMEGAAWRTVEGTTFDKDNLFDWNVDGIRVQIKCNHGSRAGKHNVWGTFTMSKGHYDHLQKLYAKMQPVPEFHVEYGLKGGQFGENIDDAEIACVARVRVLDLLDYIGKYKSGNSLYFIDCMRKDFYPVNWLNLEHHGYHIVRRHLNDKYNVVSTSGFIGDSNFVYKRDKDLTN